MGRIKWKKIRWGSLTRWLKRHEAEIKRLTGHDPFNKSARGRNVINDNTLRILAAHPEYVRKISPRSWKHIMRKIRFKLNVLNKRKRR